MCVQNTDRSRPHFNVNCRTTRACAAVLCVRLWCFLVLQSDWCQRMIFDSEKWKKNPTQQEGINLLLHKHTDYRWMLRWWARGWEVATVERSWSWRDLYVWNTPFKWCFNLFLPLQCVWCNWILSAWLRSPCCIIAAKLKRLTGHHFDSKAVSDTRDHEMDPVKWLQSNEKCPEMSYSKVNHFIYEDPGEQYRVLASRRRYCVYESDPLDLNI